MEVYKLFHSIGYSKYVSFMFAKICTTRLPVIPPKKDIRSSELVELDVERLSIKNPVKKRKTYRVLPQGAATSPMISNLISMELDKSLYQYALENNLVYTRYADDLAFSSSEKISYSQARRTQLEICKIIEYNGFTNNYSKMKFFGAGAKKLVLGLLVNGSRVRVNKETYQYVEKNINACSKHGIEKVLQIKEKGFNAPLGFYNHLQGFMCYFKDVDEHAYMKLQKKFQTIQKP